MRADLFRPAEAEAICLRDFHLMLGEPPRRKCAAQKIRNRALSVTVAAMASAAMQKLEPGNLLGFVRVVQDVFEYRLPAQDVGGKDFVDDRAGHLLVLDRHLSWDEHADNRLAAAASGAAGMSQLDIAPAGGGDVLLKLIKDLKRSRGVLTRRGADLDSHTD